MHEGKRQTAAITGTVRRGVVRRNHEVLATGQTPDGVPFTVQGPPWRGGCIAIAFDDCDVVFLLRDIVAAAVALRASRQDSSGQTDPETTSRADLPGDGLHADPDGGR